MSVWSWLGQTIGLGTQFRRFWASFAGASVTGPPVTVTTAMQIAAFWRGVNLTSSTVGTLPLNLYEFGKNGESLLVREPTNAYDALLRGQPNEDQTPTEFWEAIVGAMLVEGNGYARKHRAGKRPVAMEIVRACPFRDNNFRLRYRGVDQANNQFDVPASEIFHLKGFCFGGDEGLSVIQFGAQSLSTMLAAQKTVGRIIGSGLSSAGFLEAPGVLNPEDRERLQTIIDEYVASENPAKLMMLEGGMKYNRLSMSAADAQLLANIMFGIEEIGRWLGIPPILLGHTSQGQTMWGTGVEAIMGTWYTLGLRALLTRIERCINKRLLEPEDRLTFFAKFNADAILRGDSAAQAALFSAAAQNGWMTRNEIRKLLDLSPMAGGDELTVQVNLTTLSKLGSNQQNEVQQARAALMMLLGVTPDMLAPRQNDLGKSKVLKTVVTKHDGRGRILEFERWEKNQ